MKLHSFLLVSLLGLLADPVNATWSIIATDRATGQVGGAGATCRQTNGESLLDDDFQSGTARGALVGQAGANHNEVSTAGDELRGGASANQIISNHNGSGEQWAAVDLEGNAVANTDESCSSIALDVQGHVENDFTYSVQGNRLSSENIVYNAEKEFKKKSRKGAKGSRRSRCDDLADRLMRSMESAASVGGDSRCIQSTSGYAADTAYLVVKKPEDAEDNPYASFDILSSTGADAIAALREAYDEWRDEHPCEKRPKHHERFLPPLHLHGPRKLGAMAGGIAVLSLLGFIVKKKRSSTLHDDEKTDNSALVQKLAETVWQMWDHRNSVNDANDTATLSLEAYGKIDSEYATGFIKLCEAAKKLAQIPKETLKTLNYRLEWRRSIEGHQARQEAPENRRKIPLEIHQKEGYIWWVRNNKPSLEEYRAMSP